MSYIDPKRNAFLDSLDQAIIEAVKRRQFMTGKEIWGAVQRIIPHSSPSLIYLRVNQLVALGVLGRLEKNVGDAVLHRYYCFHDKQGFKIRSNNFTSEIKN